MQLLSSLAPSALTSFLASIDTVLFDCDGVLYRGRQLLPETVEAVEAIKNKLGKRVGFVTSADRTRQGGAKELAEMGFPAEEVCFKLRCDAVYISDGHSHKYRAHFTIEDRAEVKCSSQGVKS